MCRARHGNPDGDISHKHAGQEVFPFKSDTCHFFLVFFPLFLMVWAQQSECVYPETDFYSLNLVFCYLISSTKQSSSHNIHHDDAQRTHTDAPHEHGGKCSRAEPPKAKPSHLLQDLLVASTEVLRPSSSNYLRLLIKKKKHFIKNHFYKEMYFLEFYIWACNSGKL